MRCAVVRVIRAWRWLRGRICKAARLLACLVLTVLFLPLVPVFRLFEGVQRLLDEEGR